MDRLNYHHLRYFREVAREGHLTRAAERLNLSQPGVSGTLKSGGVLPSRMMPMLMMDIK